MRTTIKDVAAAAGVSLGTVSAVMNDSRKIGVSDATREKIRHIIQELDYQPSRAARAVAGASGRIIGILLYSPSDPYCAVMTDLLQEKLSERGYMAFFGFWNDRTTPAEAMRKILSFPIDGLILPGGHPEKLPDGLPLALIGKGQPGCFSVQMEFREALRSAAAHLKELGHTSCGFLCPRESEPIFSEFLEETAAQGLENRPEWNVRMIGQYEDFFATAMEILKRDSRPTAFVCRNDTIALAMVNAAHTLGIPVPAGLSVIGFNDMTECVKSYPPLTSIHLPAREITDALIDGVLTPGLTGTRILHPSLTVRGSTGAPLHNETITGPQPQRKA